MTQKQILKPDFCVLGAGSAGLSFVAGAIQMGASVVLLEAHKMGGDCLNYGCVPSKSLLASAKHGRILNDAGAFGWSASTGKADWAKVQEHVRAVIRSIEPNDSVERFEGLGVVVLREKGAFVSPNVVETVSNRIEAKRFIVATGSRPFIPFMEGLSDVPYLTNETIFDLDVLPKHLAIIGGGPIGIELATAFRRFGSDVTVFQSSVILPKDDPELADRLKALLKEEGITLLEHRAVTKISNSKSGVCVHSVSKNGDLHEVHASHLLVASGRRANIDELNLDEAGVQSTPNGVTVDRTLRTKNPKIYAIGDAVGGYQFTHVAGYHAGIALRNTIFKMGAKVSTKAIPWVTYTDPELAHVGVGEAELIRLNIPHQVLRLELKENDRAQAERRTEGFIKVIVTPKGKVLGASILAPHAGDLIYPWVISIQNNLSVSAIANTIAPYPTLGEITKRVASQFYAPKIFNPRMRKIVRLLMWITR